MRSILTSHPGGIEVKMVLTGSGDPVTVSIADQYRVSRSSALYGDLKAVLGPGCLA